MKKIAVQAIIPFCFSSLLSAQSRVVLIEQFTNAGCPPCAANSPSVFSYADANEQDVVAIAYHTAFPYNDSMYFENPAESDARVAYYGVPGVPYSIVDGNYYENGSNTFLQSIASTINTRKTVAPAYAIDSISLNIAGDNLVGSFKFTALANHSSDSLIAHIVVIEKNVLKSAYLSSPGANAETEYGYVMRKMLPDQNGTALINTTADGIDSVNFSWQLNHIKNNNEIKVVVFVQNYSAKEVYQAKLYSIPIQPNGIEEELVEGCKSSVCPNPVVDYLNIRFKCRQMVTTVKVINSQGAIVRSFPVNDKIESFSQNMELQPGIYNVSVEGANNFRYNILIVR